MKHTIWLLFLTCCLTTCQPKTETSSRSFDIDLLTREDGWKIDQPLTDSLHRKLLDTNLKKLVEITNRSNKNNRLKEFAKQLLSVMMVAELELNNRLKKPSKSASVPVKFIKVSDNQFKIKNLSSSSSDTTCTGVGQVAGFVDLVSNLVLSYG